VGDVILILTHSGAICIHWLWPIRIILQEATLSVQRASVPASRSTCSRALVTETCPEQRLTLSAPGVLSLDTPLLASPARGAGESAASSACLQERMLLRTFTLLSQSLP
jgi:hypothetical protein